MSLHRTRSHGLRDCWQTPDDLFQRLHALHNFTIDVAADPWNAKLLRYFSPLEDGLSRSWKGERVWCNPPYGRGLIQPWIDKALDREAEIAVLLLPSRTESPWFQQLWELHGGPGTPVWIEFLPKRIWFIPPPGVKASSPTEASILVHVKGK